MLCHVEWSLALATPCGPIQFHVSSPVSSPPYDTSTLLVPFPSAQSQRNCQSYLSFYSCSHNLHHASSSAALWSTWGSTCHTSVVLSLLSSPPALAFQPLVSLRTLRYFLHSWSKALYLGSTHQLHQREPHPLSPYFGMYWLLPFVRTKIVCWWFYFSKPNMPFYGKELVLWVDTMPRQY